MTPIRIRGKRAASKEEKWHAGKQRRPARHGLFPASECSSSGRSTSSLVRAAARKSRKRVDPDLSRLEQLPTEMLQSIFEHSANLDMPLVSPRLASQLASRFLHHQLASQILHQALGGQQSDGHNINNSGAMRLMNSKFFTWPFFRTWLHNEFARQKLQSEMEDAVGHDAESQEGLQRQEEWTWYRLGPPATLPPPSKLLRRPFTADNVQFLRFMIGFFHAEPETLGPVYSEIVQDGLQQAVEDGVGDVLNAFFCLGAQVDPELLRKAVIDAHCEKDVVQRLISRTTHLNNEPVDVDFLDPALWAWADKAKANGDEKGPWLIEQLQSAARDSGQGEGNVEPKQWCH